MMEPMQPMSPTAELPIVLEAQEWNVVLSVLADGPYKVVAPLMMKITQQAQQHSQMQSPQPSLPLNGHDRHP